MTSSDNHRVVLLAGATGLVGGHILQLLLNDPGVSCIHALSRKPLRVSHPKLQVHIVDFTSLPQLPHADEAYLALGTTIKVAGSKETFRAVDFDANLAVAQAAIRAGVSRIGLVSASGASVRSSMFYKRDYLNFFIARGNQGRGRTGRIYSPVTYCLPVLLECKHPG
ncbi:TPA: NAD(P)H-binding protein, partial [Klebsiella variicola subsp. variicola]|nr:NAD(P)H-binding protein [Klebsiella variicola subsp. variicola]